MLSYSVSSMAVYGVKVKSPRFVFSQFYFVMPGITATDELEQEAERHIRQLIHGVTTAHVLVVTAEPNFDNAAQHHRIGFHQGWHEGIPDLIKCEHMIGALNAQ